MEFYLAIKKRRKENMGSFGKRMELENNILSEVTQLKQAICFAAYVDPSL